MKGWTSARSLAFTEFSGECKLNLPLGPWGIAKLNNGSLGISNGPVQEVAWIVVEVGGWRSEAGVRGLGAGLVNWISALVRPCDVAKTEFLTSTFSLNFFVK
jgi:hypothetical protein